MNLELSLDTSFANMGLQDPNIGLPIKKRYTKTELKKTIVNFYAEWKTAEELFKEYHIFDH